MLCKKKRKLQIGVMGSAADLKYSKEIEKIAFEVGQFIAKNGNITVYGAEKDYDSLSLDFKKHYIKSKLSNI